MVKRVVRVIQYIGPDDWIDDTQRLSSVPWNGTHSYPNGGTIISRTLKQRVWRKRKGQQ